MATKSKKPFLKKGEGIARFNYRPPKIRNVRSNVIEVSPKDDSQNYELDEYGPCEAQTALRPHSECTQKLIDPNSVGTFEVLDKKIQPKTESQNDELVKRGHHANHSAVPTIPSEFAKKPINLNSLEAFELLEEKLGDASFCSTSSTVVSLVRQSISNRSISTPNKKCPSQSASPKLSPIKNSWKQDLNYCTKDVNESADARKKFISKLFGDSVALPREFSQFDVLNVVLKKMSGHNFGTNCDSDWETESECEITCSEEDISEESDSEVGLAQVGNFPSSQDVYNSSDSFCSISKPEAIKVAVDSNKSMAVEKESDNLMHGNELSLTHSEIGGSDSIDKIASVSKTDQEQKFMLGNVYHDAPKFGNGLDGNPRLDTTPDCMLDPHESESNGAVSLAAKDAPGKGGSDAYGKVTTCEKQDVNSIVNKLFLPNRQIFKYAPALKPRGMSKEVPANKACRKPLIKKAQSYKRQQMHSEQTKTTVQPSTLSTEKENFNDSIKSKISELDEEISVFKSESERLSKLRKMMEVQFEKLVSEREGFEKYKQTETKKLQEYCVQERRRLDKEKLSMQFQRTNQMSAKVKKMTNEEKLSLESKIADLEKQIKTKDMATTSMRGRLQNKVQQLEAEISKLKKENDSLVKDKNSLLLRIKSMKGKRKTRDIHLLNEKMSNAAAKSQTVKVLSVDTQPPSRSDQIRITDMYPAHTLELPSEPENLMNTEKRLVDIPMNNKVSVGSTESPVNWPSISVNDVVIPTNNVESSENVDAVLMISGSAHSDVFSLDMVPPPVNHVVCNDNFSTPVIEATSANPNRNANTLLPELTGYALNPSLVEPDTTSLLNECLVPHNDDKLDEASEKNTEFSPVELLDAQLKSMIDDSDYGQIETDSCIDSKVVQQDDGVIHCYRKYCHRVLYPNGNIEEVYNDGRKQLYLAALQAKMTTYPDGEEITEYSSGQVKHVYPSGKIEVRNPDKSGEIVLPDGSKEFRCVDGTRMVLNKNGTKTIYFTNGETEHHCSQYLKRKFSDGSVKFVYPSGKQETRYKSGRVRIRDKAGNLIIDSII